MTILTTTSLIRDYRVSHDTAHLENPEILRAFVETIAKNISDGVIVPLFYLGLGGSA